MFFNKLNDIRDKLRSSIDDNEKLDNIEKIDKNSFVVDYEEKHRLSNDSELQISGVIKELDNYRYENEIIRNRIKVIILI